MSWPICAAQPHCPACTTASLKHMSQPNLCRNRIVQYTPAEWPWSSGGIACKHALPVNQELEHQAPLQQALPPCCGRCHILCRLRLPNSSPLPCTPVLPYTPLLLKTQCCRTSHCRHAPHCCCRAPQCCRAPNVNLENQRSPVSKRYAEAEVGLVPEHCHTFDSSF